MSITATFEDIVREHQNRVFGMLVRLTGSREYVDDLAQEVFYASTAHSHPSAAKPSLTTYLHRIVVNVAQDEWKRRKREDARNTSISDEDSGLADRLAHHDPNAEQQLATRELQSRVEEELRKLSVVERSILVLYHQEERSYQQIAESLQLPIGTVRTHLHRGRHKLRTALAGTASNTTTAKGGKA